MPGREDFAIIRARLLGDPRLLDAADAYVEAGLALDDTATATVIGHVALIAIWAVRETDDGRLPGDGRAAAAVALSCRRDVAATSIRCLSDVGLLRADAGGMYVVGFHDCYANLIEKRRNDRESKADARAQAKAERELRASQRRRRDVDPKSSRRRTPQNPESSSLSPARPREGSPEGERDSPGVPPPANGHDLAERIFRPATVEDWDAMWSAVSQWAKIESRDTASAHYDLARRIVAANSKRSLRKPPSADQPLPWHDQPALTRNRDWIESIDPGALLRIARKGGAA